MTAVLLISSCANRDKLLLLDVREVDYRNHSDFVLEGKPIDIESMGLEDIIFCDSFLLVVSSDPNGMMKVYDSKSFKEVARFCYKGRARNEFISMMPFKQQYVKDGKTIIPIMDNENVLKELDFTSSIQQNSTVVTQADWSAIGVYNLLKQNNLDELPKSGDCPPVSPDCYSLIDNDVNTLFYYVNNIFNAPSFGVVDIQKQKKTEMEVYSEMMDNLSKDYHYIYSGKTIKHPERNIFIHTLDKLNYIYYFDLETNRNFAIHQKGTYTIDDELSDFELKEIGRAFTNGLCTEDFFMVIYIGGDYYVESPEESKAPELLLFDYEGNYLCGAKLMQAIHRIAYDSITKTLYGADTSEEKIYSYDFTELISSIEK